MPVRPGLLGLWSLPFVMICPEHRRPLVTLWTMQDKLDRQDGSDAGLLSKPRMVAGVCWRPSDLLIGAEPVYVAMHDRCSLAEAASRLQLVPEAIERIRDHRLARVGNIWNALDLLRFWSISAMSDRKVRRLRWMLLPIHKGCGPASS